MNHLVDLLYLLHIIAVLRWERALLALAAEENETKKDKIDATGTGAGMYDVHVTCLAVLYITLPLTSQTLFL